MRLLQLRWIFFFTVRIEWGCSSKQVRLLADEKVQGKMKESDEMRAGAARLPGSVPSNLLSEGKESAWYQRHACTHVNELQSLSSSEKRMPECIR